MLCITGNRSPTPPQNISPQSDSSSSSNLPSSTDLLVVKKEIMDESSPEQSLNGEPKSKESSDMSDDIQDMPEDLSSNNSSCRQVLIKKTTTYNYATSVPKIYRNLLLLDHTVPNAVLHPY